MIDILFADRVHKLCHPKMRVVMVKVIYRFTCSLDLKWQRIEDVSSPCQGLDNKNILKYMLNKKLQLPLESF